MRAGHPGPPQGGVGVSHGEGRAQDHRADSCRRAEGSHRERLGNGEAPACVALLSCVQLLRVNGGVVSAGLRWFVVVVVRGWCWLVIVVGGGENKKRVTQCARAQLFLHPAK